MRPTRLRVPTVVLAAAVAAGSGGSAHALTHDLPPSLAPLILSETVPFVFTPNDFSAADWAVEWSGPAIPGVRATLGENSFEWVRIAAVFDLPRAVLVVDADSAESDGLHAEAKGARPNQWMYVGCRFVWQQGPSHSTPSFEIFAFWDGVGQEAEINGVRTPSTSVSVWPVRAAAEPGEVTFRAGAQSIKLTYRVPKQTRAGFLGVGLGPYAYTFEDGIDDAHSVAPILTMYGAYFLHEAMRIVAFNATSIHRRFYNDLGLHLWTEQFRVWDARFSMNILLGGHILAFTHRDKLFVRLGGPQGLELIFRDFMARSHNLSLGLFAQPPFDGKLYYNAWVRWGKSSFFGELNYIAWQESIGNQRVYSRSFGVTVGMPLARFF